MPKPEDKVIVLTFCRRKIIHRVQLLPPTTELKMSVRRQIADDVSFFVSHTSLHRHLAKHFQARAQDEAEAEAKRLGLPSPSLQAKLATEPPLAPQRMNVTPISGDGLNPDEILLTSSQAAQLLGYTEKSFRNSVALGKIPHYKLLGQNRFKKSELLGLLVRVEPK